MSLVNYLLDNFTESDLILAAVCVVLSGWIMGFVTNAVMGDRGFGVFGNAFLTMLGAFLGLYARLAMFGGGGRTDYIVSGASAASTATVLLLILGALKNRLQATTH
ncbi:MAG: hypothetical protein KGI57_04115 [Hyphomicrobiales bacterium]|nr:hypothetical protein [Hyphomicrobiales bacterium]MDE2016872.1 hypothetical protein [Hyphomicrobiales bacterium]